MQEPIYLYNMHTLYLSFSPPPHNTYAYYYLQYKHGISETGIKKIHRWVKSQQVIPWQLHLNMEPQ